MSGSRSAVVFDFGGVLTTSVLAAFEEFGATLGDPSLVHRTMSQDPEGAALLVAHEEGRITERAGAARRWWWDAATAPTPSS